MIDRILQWLGVVEQPAQLSAVDMFISGHSIPALSAAAGQNMIAEQRRIEQQIRAYIVALEHEIDALRNAVE